MYFQILKTVKKFFNLSLSLLKVVYEKIYGNTLSTTKKIEIGKFWHLIFFCPWLVFQGKKLVEKIQFFYWMIDICHEEKIKKK